MSMDVFGGWDACIWDTVQSTSSCRFLKYVYQPERGAGYNRIYLFWMENLYTTLTLPPDTDLELYKK